MRQTKAVLDWLETGAGITSMEAFKELGVTRLSAVIFNLRRRGLNIETQTIEQVNRYGEKVRFARYVLKE